jgi:hypothetical protein
MRFSLESAVYAYGQSITGLKQREQWLHGISNPVLRFILSL